MVRVRCWTCVGNGIIRYPRCSVETCPDCKGTGIDAVKTKQINDEEERNASNDNATQ